MEEKKLIRELLQKAQNPLFFFDNDVDGLASFLLLRKFCQKGKGVAIKSFPALSVAYSRKLNELKPDYIFVLDKPLIELGFREEAKKLGMPIVWIDHHPIPNYANEENILYFNPLTKIQQQAQLTQVEPTAYICYKITGQKEYEWIAMLGCLADWYIPEFAKTFSEQYPDLFPFTHDPAKALYETKLGEIVKMLSFALMDRTTIVVQMLKNLLTINTPYELLESTAKTASIHNRYNQIKKKYIKLLNKAREVARTGEKLLFFQYGGELSMSGQIANELLYLYPDRVSVVCYIKGTKVNVALRSSLNSSVDVRQLAAKAMEGIEGTYGGHYHAAAAVLQIESLPKFRDKLIELLKK